MPIPASTESLENIERFKLWMHTEFKEHCQKTYGMADYMQYIYPCLESFLENVEGQIELLSEQSLQDEEFEYVAYPDE